MIFNENVHLFRLLAVYVIVLWSGGNLSAQDSSCLKVGVSYSWLYTTHRNPFNGVSVSLSRQLTRTVDLGINAGIAATPLHHTNGYDLSRFRNIPLAVDFTYTPLRGSKSAFFTHVTPGVSLMHYHQKWKANADDPSVRVRDYGFYLYSGIGADYEVAKKTRFFFEIGNTFFKLSTNRLDVNPRGLTLRAGCSFGISSRKNK